jgi:hypothetical protein
MLSFKAIRARSQMESVGRRQRKIRRTQFEKNSNEFHPSLLISFCPEPMILNASLSSVANAVVVF